MLNPQIHKMRPDDVIRFDVEQEILADPALDAADIAAAVHEGVVSLTGFVRFFWHKRRAEAAVKRVSGVVAVVNDIDVRLPVLDHRPDPEIARDAVDALARTLPDAAEHIQVVVHDGCVTLEGEAEWNSEREEAKWQVAPVRGVVTVQNNIRLKPKAVPDDVKAAIASAFRRSARVEANQIVIDVERNEVRIGGTVRSWAEREEAERVAWSIPGIAWVDNQLVVRE